MRPVPMLWIVLVGGLSALAAVAARPMPDVGADERWGVQVAFWAGFATVLFAALLWDLAGEPTLRGMIRSLMPKRDQGAP